MTDERRVRRWTTARTWVVVSTMAWLLLLPLNWWLSARTGPGWGIASEAVGAVVSGFAAVVLGAALFTRWEQRIANDRARNERDDWLRRNTLYVLECQSLMLHTLGDIACGAYRLVTPLLGDDVIPSDLLSDDVTRYSSPRDDPDSVVLDELEDVLRLVVAGPLATARDQVRRTIPLLLDAITDDSAPGTSRHADRVGDVYRDVTSPVAELLVEAVARALALSGELTGPRDLEPHEVRFSCLRMVGAVRGLRMNAFLLASAKGPEHPRVALEVVTHAQTLLGCVHDLRGVLSDNAFALSKAVGTSPGLGLEGVVNARIGEMARFFKDSQWEAWRMLHADGRRAAGCDTPLDG